MTMSQRKSNVLKRPALSIATPMSPIARRAQVSPLHSIPPRFRDDDDCSSSSSDNEAIDTYLEEDLLQEIRTLVKKEKYLEQLEDQLREDGDNSSDSNENNRITDPRGRRRDEPYDDEDEESSPHLDALTHNSFTRKERTTKNMQPPVQEPLDEAHISQKHFRDCFVEVNPVQLRDIRSLILSNQGLHIQHLRTLSKNLFLFSALRSVNLSNNQLDDSGSKEIRDLMCCSGLQSLDLSRNLLGRLAARTICERLRHQAKLLSLDLHGNIFFADGGSSAGEIARLFAKAVAVNESLLNFRLSVLDQRTPLSRQSDRQVPTRTKGKSTETTSAAFEFSHCLAEHLQQRGKNSSLQSLGLCYAELSRKVVLNIVTMANRLIALDLSFAFIGIPGAQVVAAALRMEDYATLTQLNLRCNRTKSMGARVILAALSTNERLTALNLSRNEIRSDATADVIKLLNQNHVLTQLDLSQNEMIADNLQQAKGALGSLSDAIRMHCSLRSLGELDSLGASKDQVHTLQIALDKNRITDDQIVLDSVNAEAAMTISKPRDDITAQGKRHLLSTMMELTLSTQEPKAFKSSTFWQRKIAKGGRFSLKWKMAVRMKQSNAKELVNDAADGGNRLTSFSPNIPIVWKVLVQRKCEVRGSLEDEACSAWSSQDQEGCYVLNSSVVYCDSDDIISLGVGISFRGDDDSNTKSIRRFKVFIKDVALIPHHPQDKRHLLASIPQNLAGTAIQWHMKAKRQMTSPPKDQEVDSSSFLWEGVVWRGYIHTTGVFRLLARVQFPVAFAGKKIDTLRTRFWWQLLRSSCWDQHTNHVVLEGTYLDLHGVVRNSWEVVFNLPPMEWMVGEYLQLSVATATDEVLLRVADVQIFHQVTHWERASAMSCLNFAS